MADKFAFRKNLYHNTSPENEKSIAKSGLVAKPDYILYPDKRPGVNLSTSPDNYADLGGSTQYKIKSGALDKRDLDHMGGGWYRHNKSIPASKIEKTK